MKYLLIICFIFISTVYASAQIDTVKHHVTDTAKKTSSFYKNTISINASSFLEKVFKSSTTPDLNSSFLYYTRNFKKFFIRAGINGSNGKNYQTNVQTNEQTVTNNYYSSASLAFYFTKNISRKFSVAYGLNVFMAYIDSSTTFVTPFDQVKNYATYKQYGVAPGVLLKYNINKRLSIFAEYMMPLKMTVSKTGTNYSLFPNENSTDRKGTNYSALIYNPISIYLSCSF
jgi:hypothetical protein